ncbi:hypothetical protein HRF59_04805 [Bacillus velezensis]|uniref:hypothetical protein n=1 Tax=Bacillus amyloliquefaciens group TaxID=1938374 RepID=UPI0014049A1D|nr:MULTISPECIES: hypothetical protein [Bacillus amyloliquefaciens group]MCA1233318.1 hypothetical protein [Bacillus velezensis]MCA1311418.1 hypothetical protein [Bacillus velezensis]MCA1330345.1 hypothetical protein [Bacillus velezensis]NHN20936.1 hypothetical protein [Bacillus amyloliquefaciens]NMP63659.1 hypothetical protein [Bacillus velezensis]
MTEQEMYDQINIQNKESKDFKRGFRAGAEYKDQMEKRIRDLESVLLEFIGYEDEWLMTKAGLNKRTRSVLVDMIIDQRYLLRTLYNKLDEETKKKLKSEIEMCIWPGDKE